jgi:hypothetical protein
MGNFLTLTVSFNNLFGRQRYFLVPNRLYSITGDYGELLKKYIYLQAGSFLPTEQLSAFQDGLFHRRT